MDVNLRNAGALHFVDPAMGTPGADIGLLPCSVYKLDSNPAFAGRKVPAAMTRQR